MLFQVSHGDIAELARKTSVPHETVRRYINGGDIRVSAARKIDSAAKEMGLIAEEPRKNTAKMQPKSRKSAEAGIS